MRALLAVPVLLFAVGGGAAQPRPDECLARLPTDLVTVSLRDTDIPITLRLMAQQYRVNLVVTDDVKGTVTLDFFKVPARDVMQAIIDAGALRCVVTGNVLRVSTIARLQAEDTRLRAEEGVRKKARDEEARSEADTRKKVIEARQAQREADEEAARGPVQEEIIPLRYADAEEVARTIAGILGIRGVQGGFSAPVALPQLSSLYVPSPPVDIPSTPAASQTAPAPSSPPSPEAVAKGLTVGFYKKTNSVFIRYYARDLERIKKMIRESLDVPLAQIQIRAQMVITTLSALEQIGVQWGAAGSGNVNGTKVLVGQGFAFPPGGVLNTGGTPVSPATPVSPPPVPPPAVGNLVNLPTAFLPTLLGATPAGGLLLGLIGSNFNVNLAIQALEVSGKARTLAEPKVVTEENTKAVISRGFEVPFTSTPTAGVQQVQFKEALLKLEVTPRLIREPGETKIRMKVVFDNDAPDPSLTVNGNPSIFKRHQETEVVIREGQRLVVGGVMNDTRSTTIREIPLFGRIPVIGWLFRSREVSSAGEELIVILTPTVVTAPGPPLPR